MNFANKEKARTAAMKLLNQFWREFTALEGRGVSSCEIFLSKMSYLKGKERKPCLKILHFCWRTKWDVQKF